MYILDFRVEGDLVLVGPRCTSLAPAAMLRVQTIWVSLVWLVGAFLYQEISANVALPPGLVNGVPRNTSLQDKFYLKVLKDKIQREIAKYRGNTSGVRVVQTDPEPDNANEGKVTSHTQFVISHSPGELGKNLLKFTINKSGEDQASVVTRVNLWIHVWQREKKRQARRKRKGKMIRISVYNNSSKDDKVIAELRTRIQGTNWFRISLPISLVRNLEMSQNSTIILRVECKRCNRKTRLMLPQMSKKKCKRNKKRRSKGKKGGKHGRKPKAMGRKRGCGTARNYPPTVSTQRLPFMIIEQRYKSFDRRKRSLSCNPSDLTYRNGTVTSSRCCRMSTYVEFSDMELDDAIVTPGGYDASRCIGRCSRMRRNRNRRRRGRNRNRNRNKRSRGGKSRKGKCRAVETSPLSVWLFDENHDLVRAELQDLVVRNCDCR
ncbi:inhibin beta A chain-like isoform X2 [Haliotis rufescens]|uniref:inhibin beta A chain-like isoform X2 n=1 Tax=Haliotis rufescens TaxID=6454 RepID=UPI001EB04079|nr:inhibin beta A chain-like isoform X2 [Haliotis rufescens]